MTPVGFAQNLQKETKRRRGRKLLNETELGSARFGGKSVCVFAFW